MTAVLLMTVHTIRRTPIWKVLLFGFSVLSGCSTQQVAPELYPKALKSDLLANTSPIPVSSGDL